MGGYENGVWCQHTLHNWVIVPSQTANSQGTRSPWDSKSL
jgi:hypothetical protein